MNLTPTIRRAAREQNFAFVLGGPYLEAVTGQLYIAVLIASLVGRRAGRSE